jgi:hypothetical protein
MQYRIRYHNAQNMPLSRVSLRVRYPDGFTFASSSVDSVTETHDEWALGTLDSDESGYIDIFGTLSGNVAEEKIAHVFLNYTPANFNSQFEKVGDTKTVLGGSPIAITISGPSDTPAGKDITFTVNVDSSSTANLPALFVAFDPGTIFRKKSSVPASVAFSDYRWALSTTNTLHSITITGTLTPPSGVSNVTIPVQIIGVKDGEDYVYSQQNYSIAIGQSQSIIGFSVNEKNTAVVVAPGADVAVVVTIKNTGSTPMEHIVPKVVIDAPSNKDKSVLKWSGVDNTNDGDIVGEQVSSQIRRGSISWNEKEVPAFVTLPPGQTAQVRFMVPVKSLKETNYDTFASMDMTFAASVQYVRDGKTEVASTDPVSVSIGSDTQFSVQDEKSQSGSTETHAVSWVIHNTLHALKDIRVEADVYGNVVFDKSALSVPAGTVDYDTAKQKIVWTIPQMPESLDVLALQMSLKLPNKNPTQSKLMSRPQFSATDAAIDKPIAMTGEEIGL